MFPVAPAVVIGGVGTVGGPWAALNYGRWGGQSVDAVDPGELARWRTDPDYAGHGGESLAVFVARIGSAIESGAGPGEQNLTVGQDVVRAALIAVLGAPAASFWDVEVDPGTELVLRHRGGRWTVLLTERTKASEF